MGLVTVVKFAKNVIKNAPADRQQAVENGQLRPKGYKPAHRKTS